jgi:hypothetical protein
MITRPVATGFMRDLLLGRPVNLERRRSLGDDALGERIVAKL